MEFRRDPGSPRNAHDVLQETLSAGSETDWISGELYEGGSSVAKSEEGLHLPPEVRSASKRGIKGCSQSGIARNKQLGEGGSPLDELIYVMRYFIRQRKYMPVYFYLDGGRGLQGSNLEGKTKKRKIVRDCCRHSSIETRIKIVSFSGRERARASTTSTG